MVKLLAFFIIVPAVELWLLLHLARVVGVTTSVILIIGTGLLGGALARHQGWNLLQKARKELEAGELPGKDLLEGAMVLLAGALLITPGILTDIAGFSFLAPRIRRSLVAGLERRFRKGRNTQNFGFFTNSPPYRPEPIDITPKKEEEEE